MTDIDGRVSSLEERIGEVDKDIAVMKVTVENSSKIQEKFEDALSEFGKFLRSVESTMSNINSEMKLRNASQKEMKDDISSLKKWLRKVDGRGNFNIVVFLADKVVPALVTVGAMYWILKVAEVIP